MLLNYLYRIKRRVQISQRKAICFLKLFEYKRLYPKRFFRGGKLSFGIDFFIHFDSSTSIVSLGNNLVFRDYCQLRSGLNGKLSIGNNNFFNNGCSLHCFRGITIGDNNQFGEGVKIYDVNHVYSDSSKLISEQGYSFGSITIGNNCWIGSNVTILKDVTIGDNAVIGANCLIHKSIPSNSLVISEQQPKMFSLNR